MFLLERHCQARRDGGEDFEQLCQSVVRLDIILVNDLEEHVHYLFFDRRSHGHKLAVNTMQDSLQVVSFTRVLAIKQLQEARDEIVRHMLDDHIMSHMRRQNEFQKKFIDELQVRPIFLQMWFILVGIDRGSLLIIYTQKIHVSQDSNFDAINFCLTFVRKGSKQVRTNHSHGGLQHSLLDYVVGGLGFIEHINDLNQALFLVLFQLHIFLCV